MSFVRRTTEMIGTVDPPDELARSRSSHNLLPRSYCLICMILPYPLIRIMTRRLIHELSLIRMIMDVDSRQGCQS